MTSPSVATRVLAGESGAPARQTRAPADGTEPRAGRLRILLTGMSAVGKSTLVARLRELGHAAIDTDDGYTTESIGQAGEVLWLEDRVKALLDGPEEVFFVAGCASNQVVFHDDFDHIVLLSAPAEVIQQRLTTRENNQFGKTAEQVAQVMADLAEVEPLLRQVADVEIVTTGSLEQTLEEVLAVTRSSAVEQVQQSEPPQKGSRSGPNYPKNARQAARTTPKMSGTR